MRPALSAFPFALSLSLLLVVAPTASMGEDTRVLLKAKAIHTGVGEVIAPGQVLIKNNEIAYVGPSIELSLPATEIDVDTIMPGMINAAGSTGLSGGEAEVSREITPDFATVNAIDWQSREFTEAIDEGVTTIQILPDTESVFSGFACVVKTAGDAQVVEAEQGVVVAICSDPTSLNRSRSRPDSIYVRQPTNRMGVVWIIRNALHQAANQGSILGVDPKTQSILEGIVKGERSVLAVSRTDYDIRSTLELGEQYNFKPTIYGGDEVYRMLDVFKESGVSLVYNAMTTSSSSLRGREGTELRWNVPGQLAEADVSFCLAGDDLLDQARFALRYGLDKEKALQAITLGPARILGLEKQIGSIEVGKQADLVALSGDPLKPTSRVEWTMVGGKIYSNKEEK
ncbi:MAG: amidohydrolase family protein [Planctomycetota bacterium]